MGILAGPTPDMLCMPRFDDGPIDMQEPLRRLVEQVINAVMDAEADRLLALRCTAGTDTARGARHLRWHTLAIECF